jgi:hypothetical protein
MTESTPFPGIRRAGAALLLLTAPILAGCAERAGNDELPVDRPQEAEVFGIPEQDAFWTNLQEQCGRAFSGGLVLEPPGDDMLTGTEELVAHFRECGFDEMRIPFHIEREEDGSWDRSRTWVLTRTTGEIELRHDHRRPDGSDDDVTWYGGSTEAPGTPNRQEFIVREREYADGSTRGWRLEIHPGERYTYGTIRNGEWTWRVDFDLGREVPAPPPPWGFEELP